MIRNVTSINVKRHMNRHVQLFAIHQALYTGASNNVFA